MLAVACVLLGVTFIVDVAIQVATVLVRDTPLATPYFWGACTLVVGLWLAGLGAALRLVVKAPSTGIRIAAGLAFAVVLAGLAALDYFAYLMLGFFLFWQF